MDDCFAVVVATVTVYRRKQRTKNIDELVFVLGLPDEEGAIVS